MNSDPNSDSKQCTDSKLGRVHSAHTHGPGCTHATHTLRQSHAHSVVSWRTLALYRSQARPRPGRVTASTVHIAGIVLRARCHVIGPSVTIQSLYRNTCPCRSSCRACRSALAPCRKALLLHIAALLPCIATPNGHPQP